MDTQTIEKARHLIHKTRVMNLSVCQDGIPWSSPVYFVFHGYAFYFFSNANSKHIIEAKGQSKVAASIFHDSDQIERIFGFQMSGSISELTEKFQFIKLVKLYVAKFNFLKKVFGSQLIENEKFFSEKFESRLYCFHPAQVYLSDNSGTSTSGKRFEIKLQAII